MLIKRVLNYVHTEDEMAFFTDGAGEPGEETTISLPASDYESAGEPEQITITIVSGDQLSPLLPTPEQALAAGHRIDAEDFRE